jgi:hypothetical protein
LKEKSITISFLAYSRSNQDMSPEDCEAMIDQRKPLRSLLELFIMIVSDLRKISYGTFGYDKVLPMNSVLKPMKLL